MIRKSWMNGLLEGLVVASASAVEDDEEFLMSAIADVMKENLVIEKAVSDKQPKVGEWIPCSERMPENAQHKGAFCPKYIVMTKSGLSVGWFNPDYDCWYVLLWFMTERVLPEELDLTRGDVPKLAKCNKEFVIAWMPLPEPYREEGDSDEKN